MGSAQSFLDLLRERRREMQIHLSDEAAQLLFFMLVRPNVHWPQASRFKSETNTMDRKIASIARWCEKRLIVKDESGNQPLKGGTFGLKEESIEIIKQHADHYKKQPTLAQAAKGQAEGIYRECPFTAVNYADLISALEGKTLPCAEDCEEPTAEIRQE